ncbi:MAG: AAA family ATPase, partial [Gammaproteobacteria bacterium]
MTWCVTEHAPDPSASQWYNLAANVANAFEAGRCTGGVLKETGELPDINLILVGAVKPITALGHLSRAVTNRDGAVEALGVAVSQSRRLLIRKITLQQVKGFEEVEVDFSTDSPLGGAWTCLAGINGAGKSTILQAIALALLGRRRAPELGFERLARMARRTLPRSDQARRSRASVVEAQIRLTLIDNGVERELVVPLGLDGVDEKRLVNLRGYSAMEQVWEHLAESLVVGYGATRNISDIQDTRGVSYSLQARRVMTLFDPLMQIASADVLLKGGAVLAPTLETLAQLVSDVMVDEEG